MQVPQILLGLQRFLQGKKTYLVGISMVTTGLANNDWNLVLQGLGLIFLRNGLAKV